MKKTFKILKTGIFALVVALFAILFQYAENPLDLLASWVAVGVTIAVVPVASITRVTNEARSPKQIKNKLWYIATDQVDEDVAFPTPNASREIATIPLLSGQYWHYIEVIKDTIDKKTTSNKTEYAYEIEQSIEFYVGGNETPLLNLLEGGLGSDFFLVYENCGTGEKWLVGTNCKPITLDEIEEFSKDNVTGWRLKFMHVASKLKFKYLGTMPTEAPTTIVADATTAALTSAQQYQFSSNSGATAFTGFTGVSDSDIGRTIDLLGPYSPPTNATTIAASGDFTLIEGATFTASENTRISFRIYKDGPTSYQFIEIEGSRI